MLHYHISEWFPSSASQHNRVVCRTANNNKGVRTAEVSFLVLHTTKDSVFVNIHRTQASAAQACNGLGYLSIAGLNFSLNLFSVYVCPQM